MLALNSTIAKEKGPNTPGSSGVARSLALARHLLYASPLALRLNMLRTRLRDMNGTNMVLWPGICPAIPGLSYATAW